MRPVNRGDAPRQYTSYGSAQPDLVARIGGYCSYCERQIETHLAVEHVQPKSHVPGLELVWENFLLGCVNCNSSKGKTTVIVGDFLWPDIDNTLRAFSYRPGGLVEVHPDLTPALRAKAEALVRLVGLDKHPGNPDSTRWPTSHDLRWLRRHEAEGKVAQARNYLATIDTEEARDLITSWFLDAGMFSIWYWGLAHDEGMRRRLVEAIPGTCPDCFDESFLPVPRPAGST